MFWYLFLILVPSGLSEANSTKMYPVCSILTGGCMRIGNVCGLGKDSNSEDKLCHQGHVDQRSKAWYKDHEVDGSKSFKGRHLYFFLVAPRDCVIVES